MGSETEMFQKGFYTMYNLQNRFRYHFKNRTHNFTKIVPNVVIKVQPPLGLQNYFHC